jgi:hypothetical protein
MEEDGKRTKTRRSDGFISFDLLLTYLFGHHMRGLYNQPRITTRTAATADAAGHSAHAA